MLGLNLPASETSSPVLGERGVVTCSRTWVSSPSPRHCTAPHTASLGDTVFPTDLLNSVVIAYSIMGSRAFSGLLRVLYGLNEWLDWKRHILVSSVGREKGWFMFGEGRGG